MPRSPEQPSQREAEPKPPFLHASRFASYEESQQPYDTIQAIVRDEAIADFSVLRFLQNWPDAIAKAPPSSRRWYVAAIGNTPPPPLVEQVTEALSTGEPVALPDEVIAELVRRREQAIDKRPYTEIHRTIVFRREDQKKEKLKRKMQKQSRKKNRGK